MNTRAQLRKRGPLFLAAGLACVLILWVRAPRPSLATPGFVWDASAVEHLYNRAGFGASPEMVEQALLRQPQEIVEQLLSGGREIPPFQVDPLPALCYLQDSTLEPKALKLQMFQLQRRNRSQRAAYTRWWIDGMVSGADPLRDRMTLFWQGLLTTSHAGVRRSNVMIEHHRLLRREALGNYGTMLREALHGPALLEYLDNDVNKSGAVNENLARELLELFSLGEGNYSERDVQEVARALTGMDFTLDGEYICDPREHDAEEKLILGERGCFDGNDVVSILLRQDACARWIAGRLIEYLEGTWPPEERLEHYASLLRQSDYELTPFLRTLFLDPEFYAETVREHRVQSPIDFLVGATQRTGVRVPASYLGEAAAYLGQELFYPPNVKGWQEGAAWISTSTLMTRCNLIGEMLGVLNIAKELQSSPTGKVRQVAGASRIQSLPDISRAFDTRQRRGPDLARECQRLGIHRNDQVAARLLSTGLAIEAPLDLLAELSRWLQLERDKHGLTSDSWLENGRANKVLTRALHWVLSLPAAQLN